MATHFTQDALLDFLQRSGGSVKNADLLLHFRTFIRDHPDRSRNRELFKKFVNSVATVQQVESVSYVVLRKKFRGHVSGGSEQESGVLAGKSSEATAGKARKNPAGRAKKPRQKPQLGEVSAAAAPAGTTMLPAAGIVTNNKSVETIFNLQQVASTPDVCVRAAAAPVVSHVSEKEKIPSLSEPPAHHQLTSVGQHIPGVGPRPGITPVVDYWMQAPVPEPSRGTLACLQSEGGLHHHSPPPHSVSLHPQEAPCRLRHRQSYKSAVSFDDDEDEEETLVKPSPAGGAGPRSAPLGNTGRAISASSPCITDPPAPPSVLSSSFSSSERMLPKIYIQNVNEEVLPTGGPDRIFETALGHTAQQARPGREPRSFPSESTSTRRSLPLEAEFYVPPANQAEEVVPCNKIHLGHGLQPVDVQPDLRQGPDHSLSSSHNSIFSPPLDAGLSNRELWWNSSYEEVQSRTGKPGGDSKIEEVLQRAQGTRIKSVTHHANPKTPWHHSSDRLHNNHQWRCSTGDLHNDHEEAESSDGSMSSPRLRERPAVTKRLSSRLRNRMCRSLGASLDQLSHEEARGAGRGSEAARLNRLHLISSSLSLCPALSSSSLSSCSTPSRYQSFTDLVEGIAGITRRRSLPAAHDEDSSSRFPLDPREHAWLVKGATGAWPDIYSLFREDSSLLNRCDFISGFTVLHWIAKHGDHRVLNTLWYGVQKVGLTFDINARSAGGHTPLHIAAIHGHKNIIRLLVNKFKADIKLRDMAGKKAWQYLSRTVPSDVFQLLGAPPRAVGRGDKEQQHSRRLQHHFSSASSGQRPKKIKGSKVKRSSSLAAFFKHKSLHPSHGHQSDLSVSML